MSGRTRKIALFMATEDSTFETDPSTNGSGYSWVPALMVGLFKSSRERLPTNYQTGRDAPTLPVLGADGGSFDCEVPLLGLATAAGHTTSPPSNDWLDTLLDHIFTSSTSTAGKNVGSGSTSSTLVLATSGPHALQDLVPVFEANKPSTGSRQRTQWSKITDAASAPTYSIAPNWSSAPTSAGVCYGHKRWSVESSVDGGGNSLAFVYVLDSEKYTMLGCRVTKAVIVGERGKVWRLKLTIAYSSCAIDAGKSSLPTVDKLGRAPCKWYGSPFTFNGTAYPVPQCEIDLGLKTAELEAQESPNGRAANEVISARPVVSVSPQWSSTIRALSETGSSDIPTNGPLIVQIGAGVLSGGVLNTLAFHAELAYPKEANPTDSDGRLRAMLPFECVDPGVFSGSTVGRFGQLVRA